MAYSKELLDELLKDYKSPEDMMGQNGIIKRLSKALIERAMASATKFPASRADRTARL